jgi:murine toxin
MLSLGRAGGLAKSTYNASDVAKQLLIRHARRTLRICQQDLLFLGAAKPEAHLVCQWIVDALIDNGSLIVQIVVSPIDASGAGDQYSWGSGAVGTFAFLRKLVETRVGSQAATPVLRRLCVAPLAFTLDVPGKQESVDYRWPEVPKKVWAGRFGTSVPVPSVTTYPPAPGNHSKVFMVDDRAYLIGSDNLYPHNLAEFSYLVEGPAVEEFKTAYWDEVWSFSEELCVSNCCAAHRQVEEIDEIFEL